MTPQLSAENQRAPEAGLEPTTNRLTEVGLSQEFAHLPAVSANARPLMDEATFEVARRVVAEFANGTLTRTTGLRAADAVIDASARDDESPQSSNGEQVPMPGLVKKPAG
jgi:hypothetical protein